MSTVTQRGAEILRKLPNGPCKAAEVGVWDGRLSELLLCERPELTLYMVDRWAAVPSDHRYAVDGSRALGHKTEAEFAAALYSACERTMFARDRVQILVGESVGQARCVLDGILDLCFLDADHSYDGVREDLSAWWPKVKVGGWLSGHDWNHPHQGRVMQAVNDWKSENGRILPIELGQDRTWFMKRRRA